MIEDRTRANLYGTRIAFLVTDTTPKGIVLISNATYINVENNYPRSKNLTDLLRDIGGLGPQIQRVREMIECLCFPGL